MSASPVITLFVYGSLRVGGGNPHASFLHSRCRHAGVGIMRGRLFRNGTQWGALYEPDGNLSVRGDVFELPPDSAESMLLSLDRYEGIGAGLPAPPGYHRRIVSVTIDASAPVVACWAWLYVSPLNGWHHVRSGDALAGRG
jgi:gamma-glutamylcyclotransferase (GGCT)/AIG2-like uncharacterized protein YtfP